MKFPFSNITVLDMKTIFRLVVVVGLDGGVRTYSNDVDFNLFNFSSAAAVQSNAMIWLVLNIFRSRLGLQHKIWN